MTPVGTAPMSCPEARALVSERLDGAAVGPAVEQHLRGCPGCSRFEDSALTVRRALRAPSLTDRWVDIGDEDDDLTAAVMASIAERDDTGRTDADLTSDLVAGTTESVSWPVDPDERGAEADLAGLMAGGGRLHHPSRALTASRRSGRVRAALAGVAVFALCVAIGFASVHWQGGVMPAVAGDRSTVVSQGQVLVHSLQAGVTLFEVGPTGAPTHQAGGTLRYAAPEAVSLRLSDGTTTSEVGVNGEVAWRVGADPGSVRGREPFDAAGWSALEVVVPVDAFGRDPGAVAATEVDGHPAWQVTTSVAQVSELLGALRTGFTWRPLDASDTSTLWLDRDTGVPLRIEVTPATDPDRAAWAARQGLVEPATGPTFVVALDDVVINGADRDVPVPSDLSSARDLGFVDRAVSTVELPEPTWTPAGMTPYRSGEHLSQGDAGPVVERTWTNGRSWLKVSGTRQWTGNRLFGDLGPLVRPLGDDPGDPAGQASGPVYRSEDGAAVAVHAEDLDVVVTGSLSEDDLVRVARSLPIEALAVPSGWTESSAISLDDLGRRLDSSRPVLAPSPDGLQGADGAVLDRVDAVEVAITGPGARGVRIVEAPGDTLAPVEDPDARVVVVRGVTGRFSPTLDELTWSEHGHVIVMSTHTASLDELLALAESMRWVT